MSYSLATSSRLSPSLALTIETSPSLSVNDMFTLFGGARERKEGGRGEGGREGGREGRRRGENEDQGGGTQCWTSNPQFGKFNPPAILFLTTIRIGVMQFRHWLASMHASTRHERRLDRIRPQRRE